MKCPADGQELTKQTYEADIEIEKCQTCGGIWLDDNELERIQSTSERDYSDSINRAPDLAAQAYAMAMQQSKPTVCCPGCGNAMERIEHAGCSQIMVDTCPSCSGVWLDDGELKALEVFFEKTAAEVEAETAEVRTGFFTSLRSLFGK